MKICATGPYRDLLWTFGEVFTFSWSFNQKLIKVVRWIVAFLVPFPFPKSSPNEDVKPLRMLNLNMTSEMCTFIALRWDARNSASPVVKPPKEPNGRGASGDNGWEGWLFQAISISYWVSTSKIEAHQLCACYFWTHPVRTCQNDPNATLHAATSIKCLNLQTTLWSEAIREVFRFIYDVTMCHLLYIRITMYTWIFQGCWMDDKGCLYTIPYGSNSTLWKMLVYIYISIRAQGLPVALANRNTSLAPVIRDAIAVTLWSSLRAGIADHGNSGLVGGRKSGENVSRPSRSFL